MSSDERRFLFAAIMVSLFFPLSVVAAPPATMTYQGRLTDNAGEPVDDTLDMSFRIFEAETGGQSIWSDSFETIDINDGSFSVPLYFGEQAGVIFDGRALWLEVKVGDDILRPRSQIDSVPYAIYAGQAAEAMTLDGNSFRSVVEAAGKEALHGSIEGVDIEIEDGDADLAGIINHLLARIDALEDHLATSSDDPAPGEFVARLEQVEEELWGPARSPNPEAPDGTPDGDQCAHLKQDRGLVGSTQALECLTAPMTLMTVNGKDSLVFEEINIHLRDGQDPVDLNDLQDPDRDWGPTNGLGNLIVGYDEAHPGGGEKTGSHNIVVGPGHSYTSVGGFVAGVANYISAPGATVSGGLTNYAAGPYSSINGGAGNVSLAALSSINGGASGWIGTPDKTQLGMYATISGGIQNRVCGHAASISGGFGNLIGRWDQGDETCSNIIRANYASISGGAHNVAYGHYSSISGGENNRTGDSGSLEDGKYSSISGGKDWQINEEYGWGAGPQSGP